MSGNGCSLSVPRCCALQIATRTSASRAPVASAGPALQERPRIAFETVIAALVAEEDSSLAHIREPHGIKPMCASAIAPLDKNRPRKVHPHAVARCCKSCMLPGFDFSTADQTNTPWRACDSSRAGPNMHYSTDSTAASKPQSQRPGDTPSCKDPE